MFKQQGVVHATPCPYFGYILFRTASPKGVAE